MIAHEWMHNYLAFRPLGIRYFTNNDIQTMNETGRRPRRPGAVEGRPPALARCGTPSSQPPPQRHSHGAAPD